MNYQLKEADSDKRINNFSGDVKDSEAYAIVMEQVAPANLKNKCKASNITKLDSKVKRAAQAIQHAENLGCNPFVKPKDISSGNPKLNLAFVATLFNPCPGLKELDEEEKKDVFGLDDDVEG